MENQFYNISHAFNQSFFYKFLFHSSTSSLSRFGWRAGASLRVFFGIRLEYIHSNSTLNTHTQIHCTISYSRRLFIFCYTKKNVQSIHAIYVFFFLSFCFAWNSYFSLSFVCFVCFPRAVRPKKKERVRISSLKLLGIDWRIFHFGCAFNQKQRMEFSQSLKQTWSLSLILCSLFLDFSFLLFFLLLYLNPHIKRELFHTRAHIYTIHLYPRNNFFFVFFFFCFTVFI